MNHSKNKEHTQKYRTVLALNRNSAGFNLRNKEQVFTLVSDDCQGAYVTDIDGNKYIDLTMGFGSILFGHNHEPIRNAIQKQLAKNWSVGPISPVAGQLAERIARITKTDRVGFFNSGTEAVMVALRSAKAITGKKYFVFFKGSYHGTFDSLLTIKSHRDSNLAQETIPGVTQSILNESFLFDYGSPESIEFIKENHDKIAAVLVEPVQSRNPGLQPREYLHQLREITEVNNVALIFDEVISGFRIGLQGAQGYFGIQADIMTYGKVIGGGLPIGLIAGKSRFLDSLDGGHWQYGDDSAPKAKATFVAGTFCHHPLALAASMKVLDLLEENDGAVLKILNQRTKHFCDEMNHFFETVGIRISIARFGSLFRFETPGRHKAIYHQLLMNGVYIWEGKNCFISPAHTDEILTTLKEKIKLSCQQLIDSGHIKAVAKQATTTAIN